MFEWFTTIPGILIACGVLLLVISVVLFILGNKRDSKDNNNNTVEVKNEDVVNQPITNDTVTVVEEEVPVAIETPTIEEQPASENTFDFSVPTMQDVTPVSEEQPVSENTFDFSVSEENTATPSEENVVAAPIEENNEEIKIVEPVVEEPVITIPDIEETKEEL